MPKCALYHKVKTLKRNTEKIPTIKWPPLSKHLATVARKTPLFKEQTSITTRLRDNTHRCLIQVTSGLPLGCLYYQCGSLLTWVYCYGNFQVRDQQVPSDC